jgi:hypothetical protein
MSKQKEIVVFREVKVGEYVLRFWPSDNGWMCGITSEMMQALTEQSAQQALDKKAENARELGLDYEPAQQEPVALVIDGVLVKSELPEKYTGHLYTSPPAQQEPVGFAVMQLPWVGLTDEEIDDLSRTMVKGNKSVNWLCQAIEAKLKEKNNG